MDPAEADLTPLARALGDLLATRRNSTGLSQRELGRAIGYGRSTIAGAETGSRIPSKAFWTRADQTLGNDGALLNAYRQIVTARKKRRREAVARDQAERDARATQHLLTGKSEIDDVHAQSQLRASAESLDASAAVLRGFDSAITETRGTGSEYRAGNLSDVIEEVRRTALTHRHAYRYMPHEVLLPQALAHLNAIVSLRPGAQSALARTSLITVLGEMAALVGTLASLDMQDVKRGNFYLTMAINAAREAGNADLLSFTLGARAFHAAYSGHLEDGIDYAEGGLEEARKGNASATTRAWLAAVASELHATKQNDYQCQRLLEESIRILSTREAEEPWIGVGMFDASKLKAYRGGNLKRLGRYVEAQTELHNAFHELPITAFKHRATAAIDLAESYMLFGDIGTACHWAGTSLALTTQTQHVGSLNRIKQLHRGMRAVDHNAAAVRVLGEQLIMT